ncbi:uncharacterized protein LOC113337062 [Papaver somniferum]|uniref:uncharacterized protein LOC113337062 n=1 Tax=Papaver somniferum TaxID=3469 RepID=UPI000E7013EC|nr:uncharacterized protein LOC113337062 [Papaver somniferum]
MAEGICSSDLLQVNTSVGDNQCSSEMSFCEICTESKAKNETRNSTSKCSHIYCSECITKLIEAKIQENISMITCPGTNCKETLEPYLCRDIISVQVLDRWENALCESSVITLQKIYCPFKDCSGDRVQINFAINVETHGLVVREAVREYEIAMSAVEKWLDFGMYSFFMHHFVHCKEITEGFQGSSMESLPSDIVQDILSRVPAESVL